MSVRISRRGGESQRFSEASYSSLTRCFIAAGINARERVERLKCGRDLGGDEIASRSVQPQGTPLSGARNPPAGLLASQPRRKEVAPDQADRTRVGVARTRTK